MLYTKILQALFHSAKTLEETCKAALMEHEKKHKEVYGFKGGPSDLSGTLSL